MSGVRGLARELVVAAKEIGAEAIFFDTPEAAGEWLRNHLRGGDLVLLKGSRGVRLERALESLREPEPTLTGDKTAGEDGAPFAGIRADTPVSLNALRR